MIAYRHHLFYDKLVQGKVLCSRALLEKDYAKKFIHKKYDHFKEQLDKQDQVHHYSASPTSRFNTTAKKGKAPKNLIEEVNPLDEQEQDLVKFGLNFKSTIKSSIISQ